MSQHDMNIANQLRAAFRSDLNDALGALATNNSGASAPSTTWANQWWPDTTNSLLKKRNNANSAWQTFADIDFQHLLMGDGTVGAPAYSFSAEAGSGLYRIGSNNLGLAINGAKVIDIGAGVVGLPVGAVGAPGLYLGSDAATGVYRIGSHNLGLSINGTKLLDMSAASLAVSGSLAVTNPSAAPGTFTFDGGISAGVNVKTSSATNGSSCMAFKWSDNSTIGSITLTNSTTTAFNTSSDKDMKDDLGAFDSVAALRGLAVRRFKWKANDVEDVGVFAQDANLVEPRAVTVGDDAIDEETGRKVRPWMVDYSKFVPNLIAGWQHLDARVSALEAA